MQPPSPPHHPLTPAAASNSRRGRPVVCDRHNAEQMAESAQVLQSAIRRNKEDKRAPPHDTTESRLFRNRESRRNAQRGAARIAEPAAAGGACSARAHACGLRKRARARARVLTPKADSEGRPRRPTPKADAEGRLGRLTRRDNSEDRLLVCACACVCERKREPHSVCVSAHPALPGLLRLIAAYCGLLRLIEAATNL